MSFTKTVDNVNYAAEISGRRRQDLPTAADISIPNPSRWLGGPVTLNPTTLDKNNPDLSVGRHGGCQLLGPCLALS